MIIFYKHYKGKHYRVLNIAHHTEIPEKIVVYQQLYENKYSYGYVWCRPYNIFFQEIQYENKMISRNRRNFKLKKWILIYHLIYK